MVTLHAGGHPHMGHMHKPEVDPRTRLVLLLERRDKRSVIPIEAADLHHWLEAIDQAQQLLRLAPPRSSTPVRRRQTRSGSQSPKAESARPKEPPPAKEPALSQGNQTGPTGPHCFDRTTPIAR